jgi:putative DNA primase/helicase
MWKQRPRKSFLRGREVEMFKDNNAEETSISAEVLKAEIKKLSMALEAVPHSEILTQLLKQIKPLDFNALANPKKEDGFKIGEKHYLVLTIGEILSIAKKNRWDMCRKHNFIYLFNGNYWSEIDDVTIQKFLGKAAEVMGVPTFSARHYLFREKLFKQFLSDAFLPTPEVSKGKVLINLLNGTFEISSIETILRPFNPSDFITYQLQFEYDPAAKAPIFQTYLDRVLPDLDSQKVLAEYLGYIFIKHDSKVLKLEKVLLLYGTGANGKSVFFEVVSALLGSENLSNFTLPNLLSELGYYRAKIGNKLVNFASELNGKIGNNALFKQMVSGEAIEARLPYGHPFILSDYAKLIFNTNELPKDVEQNEAFFRRFLIVPFNVTIPKEERDSTLPTRIIESELAGVFNWTLEGLKRLLEQKQFTSSKAIEEAVQKYREESDTVFLFLAEYDYVISNNYTALSEIYGRYHGYCYSNGFRPCSSSTFVKRLRVLGYQTVRKNYGTAINAEIKRVL